MSGKYDVVFERLAEATAEDPSTYHAELAAEYDYSEANELDELRRASLAIQAPEPQSLSST